MTETEQEWTVLAGVTEHLPSALLVLLFQVQTNLIILRADLRSNPTTNVFNTRNIQVFQCSNFPFFDIRTKTTYIEYRINIDMVPTYIIYSRPSLTLLSSLITLRINKKN